MSRDNKWTIAIRSAEGQQPRKITKIIGLNGGGFSVLMPYHKARSGYLFKAPVDPSVQGEYQLPWGECVGFTADDRVKLSYHTDGFAQFSSETPGRVISGRDPATGEPKGLGLFTRPLTSPIRSGASVGVTIRGIEEFEEVEEHDDPLIFEPSDFYYRGTTPEEATGWILEIYAFPIGVIPPLRFHHGNPLLEVALEPLNPPFVSVVQLKVVHLPAEKVFLGLLVDRIKATHLPKSGWILSGPGDFTQQRKGHTLMGIYPRENIPVEGRGSLDRTPVTGSSSDQGATGQ